MIGYKFMLRVMADRMRTRALQTGGRNLETLDLLNPYSRSLVRKREFRKSEDTIIYV